MGTGIKVFQGHNFKVESIKEIPSLEYIESPDLFYDERNQVVSIGLQKDNWEWYFNYLDFTQTLASRNPNAKALWLLDLGYIPVVYMPSCCSSTAAQLFSIMDEKNIPYVKTRPYSFVTKYVTSLDMDGWVSKMDISRITGWTPHTITTAQVLKELIL